MAVRDNGGNKYHDDKDYRTIRVRPGELIQDAINKASPRDRIVVSPGTYAEQVSIDKDGISLVGFGATIIPPDHFVPNGCTGLAGNGTEAGICVFGSGLELAPFVFEHRKVLSVAKPVKDVSVIGFQVSNFVGENIAVVGAENTRVARNRLINGERYGFLTTGAYDTLVTDNIMVGPTGLGDIGLCMDDFAGVEVSRNRISGYRIGLCVQTPEADVHDNDVSEGCVGAFIDPGIVGARIVQNHITGNSDPDSCLSFGLNTGVIIDGAVNSTVQGNTIEGETNAAGQGAGIVIVDEPGSIASGNAVIGNTLRHNDLDLYVNSTGTGNVLDSNRCSTSFPDGLCA